MRPATRKLASVLLALACILASARDLHAQSPHAESTVERYERTDTMVAMRDGVRLHTEVYSPRNVTTPRGIIFLRSPYGVSGPGTNHTRYFPSTFRVLAEDDYIFVVQDARGRFKSEGKFVWNRPLRDPSDETGIDPSTDAWDSIDWLVKNVPNNNGHVGMLGVSYPGWYVTMALIDAHPALAAASPQASPSDYFIGDDFYHFGAFRLSPSAELPYLFDFDPKANSRFPYDQVCTYEFFLDLGPLSNMNARYLRGASPTWDSFLEHATYDEFWMRGNTLQHLGSITTPTLNVVGWWDAENLGGQLDIYTELQKRDEAGLHKIVVGPWSHGQWSRAGQRSLGAYEFGADTSEFYQREVEAVWFRHHLHGGPDPDLPEALMFQTGTNRWQRHDQWPPTKTTTQRALYMQPSGGLSFAEPTGGADAFATYVSDPAKPVPYSRRPIMGFWQGLSGTKDARFQRAGKLWKVEDQRFVSDRPDVLTFVTDPLEEDLAVTGRIVAKLFASSSGTDCDWVVKLIDVYPERYEVPELGGFQLMIADDVLRAKFRNGFTNPTPLTPGKVKGFEIDLRTRNHMFRKGHRIMVQVQSTWFPLIDRNPQVFTDIPKAKSEDFRAVEQRVYFSAEHPSHILLDVGS